MNNDVSKRVCNDSYEIETINDCPVCHSDFIRMWLSAKDELLKKSSRVFHYYQCEKCKAYFLKDRPTPETISYFYKGEYAPYKQKKVRKISRLELLNSDVRRSAQRYIGMTEAISVVNSMYEKKLSGGRKKIVDFGCGAGSFLNKVQKKYDAITIGMDFNEEILDKVAQQGHAVIPANHIGWDSIESGSTDVFRCNHTFEHLHSPHIVLEKIFDKLKKNGVLHMVLPNPDGYSAQRFQDKWFGLECPRHLVLYPQATIKNLLVKYGFVSIEVRGQPVIKDLIRSENLMKGRGDYVSVPHNGFFELYKSLKHKWQLNEAFDRFDVFAVKPES